MKRVISLKKIKITNRKDKYELSYQLVREQKINEWALKNLGADKSSVFLPVEASPSRKITVSLQGCCSLREYLPMLPQTKQTFMRIALGITEGLQKADALHYNRHSILLDPEYVMINPSEITVRLVYIPADPFERIGTLNEIMIYLAENSRFQERTDTSFLNRFIENTRKDETTCFLEMQRLGSENNSAGKSAQEKEIIRCPDCNALIVGSSECSQCGYDIHKAKSRLLNSVKKATIWLQRCSNGEFIPVKKYPFRIGKSTSTTDYCVNNRYVSNIHAEILSDGKSYYIIDRNSTNGTFLNKQPLAPSEKYALSDSDVFTLGNESFIFRIK